MPSISKIDSLEKQVENLSKLVEINSIINSSLNINELFSIIMEMIKGIMDVEASSLLLYDDINMELVFKVALGEAGQELKEKYRVKLGQGIAGSVALERKSCLVNDVYSDSRFDPTYDRSVGFTTRAILCAPLLFKGKLLGVIQAINPVKKEEFDDDDMNLFLIFSNQAALAVQNALFFQKAIEDERLESELRAAKNIQEFLTPDFNISDNGFTSAARSIPVREVGGIFHMFREYGDGVYLVSMGSVDPRGIPGALRASGIYGAIRVMTGLDVRDPAEIIEMINRICVFEKGKVSPLALFICLVDIPNRRFDFVNTGDICPIMIRGGVARYLRFSDRSRGDIGRRDFRAGCARIQVKPGDRFVMLSGSIRELKNSDGKKVGLARVAKFLESCQGASSAIINSLLSFTEKHTGGLDRRKDMSVLAFTFGEDM
jgi:sigma-B regulation protein RsbU (phosphoserine phosphatase)